MSFFKLNYTEKVRLLGYWALGVSSLGYLAFEYLDLGQLLGLLLPSQLWGKLVNFEFDIWQRGLTAYPMNAPGTWLSYVR